MEINIIKAGNILLAEIRADEIIIHTVQDALDIMADCRYQGCDALILNQKNITPEFFDLKTKLAGDILQKFSTYQCGLAIVGDFSKVESKSLKDFIYESNKMGRTIFVENLESAIQHLRK